MEENTAGSKTEALRLNSYNVSALLMNRELGAYPSQFQVMNTHKLKSHISFVSNLSLKTKLVKHTGCVNTIEWNSEGTLLITGSDDRNLNIWRSRDYKLLDSIESEHLQNIFHAKFVPETNDEQTVSLGMDGIVRHWNIEKKVSKTLGSWGHMLYKLCFLPDDPKSFLTTHQEGQVYLFDLRTSKHHKLFSLPDGIKSLSAAFCPSDPNYFIVGGGDPFVRLFDIRKMEPQKDMTIRKYCPQHIADRFNQNSSSYFGLSITGVDFNSDMEILANYSGEDVYLFRASLDYLNGWGEQNKKEPDTVNAFQRRFSGRKNVQTFLKEVAFMGGNEYVTTGSDCGKLYIWEKSSGDLVQCLKADEHIVNGVAPHPVDARLAACGIDSHAKIFDVGPVSTFERVPNPPVAEDDDEPLGIPVSMAQLLRLLSRIQGQDPFFFFGEESGEEEEEDDQ